MTVSPLTLQSIVRPPAATVAALPHPGVAFGGGEEDGGQAGPASGAQGLMQQVAGATQGDAPEGGVSLFQGVLKKALIGGGLGAAAGFVLPFGGPIMGGIIGAIAGAGWQVYKNYRNIKSIQEYNAALLAQSGVTPTSEEEVNSLVSGQVPDQAVTEASVGNLVSQAAQQGGAAPAGAAQQGAAQPGAAQPGAAQQAAAQQAAAQQAAPQLTPAQQAAQAAEAEYRATAQQYRVVVTDKGSYTVHQSFQIPTTVSHTQAAQYYASLAAEHQKSVAALETARQKALAAVQAANGSGAPAQSPAVDAGPSQSSQPAVEPGGINQSQGASIAPPAPSAGANTGAQAVAGTGGSLELTDDTFVTMLKRRIEQLRKMVEEMQAESERRRIEEREYWERRAARQI